MRTGAMTGRLGVGVAVALVLCTAGCSAGAGQEPGLMPEPSSSVAPIPTISLDEGKQAIADAISAARHSLEPTVSADQWEVRNGIGVGICPDLRANKFYSDIHGTPYEITSEDLRVMAAALADLGFTLPPEADVIPGKLTSQGFIHKDGYILKVMSGDGRGTRMSGETPCLARDATATANKSQEN